jgi:DNA-binding CsgD family transcriptional regulator
MGNEHSAHARNGCIVEHRIPAAVGILDSGLRIERICSEAESLFNRPVQELIGTSLLSLVTENDVTRCRTAYAEACASQRGVTVNLHVCVTPAGQTSEELLCEVVITSLHPSRSCAFVVQPVLAAAHRLDDEAVTGALNRCGRAVGHAVSAPGGLTGVSGRDVPGLGHLTVRELQVVSRLLDGYRPPAIARSLFLSQSTVRNHLASVFNKLGVASQEALLELFRTAPWSARPHAHVTDQDRVTRGA